MKSGKRVLSIVIVSLLLISFIGLVSAGFWSDLFSFGEESELEGELADTSTASVGVTGTEDPPEIVFVGDVNDANYRVGFEQSETWNFTYLAYSQAGTGFLPPNGGSLVANISDGVNISVAKCSKAGEVSGAAYQKSGNLANYTCETTLWYYYHSQEWTIYAYVQDNSGKAIMNATKTFPLALNPGMRLEPKPTFVNWTSIVLGAAPSESANEIMVVNIGNDEINFSSYLSVTGYMLNGTDGGKEDQAILALNFSADEIGQPACGQANNLSEGQPETIDAFDILYTDSDLYDAADKNLTFCLGRITGIDTQEYRTVDNFWSIDVTWN
jgi:hypothetical protein